ncbi:hypothetical protein [Escherichia coli]|uniref:hypothetical protein n=1 Tax=Escherichia coli TaxID=562 RepID=UPI002075C50F|nr:hypothetical protein [Escherichia coli]
MTLKQRFADTWQATLNATHSEVEFDSKMMYVDAYVNKADGMLVGPYSNYGPGFDYVGGTGWNSGKRKVDALDLFADGSYELFGRQHNLMFGGSYSKQNNRYFSSWANIFRMKLAVSTTLMAIPTNRLVTTEPGAGRYHTYEIVICCHSCHPCRSAASDPRRTLYHWRVDTLTYSMEKTHHALRWSGV